MPDEPPRLRERTRRAVRAELMTVALDLFVGQGYDVTTVEQISAAVGLSRRSFFRYFTSKDELLIASLAGVGESIAAELAARPAGETPWIALRRSFEVLLNQIASDDRSRAMTRVMLQSPSMNTNHAAKQTSWSGSIATALEPRLPVGPDAQLGATALAAAALACLTMAQSQWVEAANATPLAALLDIAMSAVGDLGDKRQTVPRSEA